jgi:cytochrome c2
MQRGNSRPGPSVDSRLLTPILGALLILSCAPTAAAPTPTPRTPTGVLPPAIPVASPAASPSPSPSPSAAADPENGRRLIAAKGCGTCHSVEGVPGATGLVGPRLNNISLRPTLAGDAIQNSRENMMHWIMDPPSMKPGTAMPKLGLTEQEAQDIAAFLYSQPNNPQR